MRRKYLSTIFVVLLCFLINNISVSASPTTKITIGGEEIQLQSDNKITVPVNIENNSGIMGFKITAEYPNDILVFQEAKQGTVTVNGNFSSNESNGNKVTVLWNNTSQISNDGSLFELVFTVKDYSKNGKIILSYSEQDTFDENYENVPFRVHNIDLIRCANNNNSNAETSHVDATRIYNELDTILSKYDLQNLNEKQKGDLLKEANTVMDNLIGNGFKSFSSIESLEAFFNSAKINAAVDEIKKVFSMPEIESIVDETLKDYHTNSISSVPKDKKTAFAEDIRELITVDNTEIINELDDDEFLEAVERITAENTDPKLNIESKKSKINYAVIFMSVGMVIVLLLVVFLTIKHKKTIKEEK